LADGHGVQCNSNTVTVDVVLSGAMILGEREIEVICWVVTALGFQLGVLVLVASRRAGR